MIFFFWKGNAIIAELLRLSDHVPNVFRLDTKETQRKYGNIIFDFAYHKKSEFYENRIENSAVNRVEFCYHLITLSFFLNGM